MEHLEHHVGPWEVDEAGQIVSLGGPDAPVVLGLLYGYDHPDGPLPEITATGNAIAAVPKLLAACKAAMADPCTHGSLSDDSEALLRGAIAEAAGAMSEIEREQLEGFDCHAGFAGMGVTSDNSAQSVTCANCGEASTNPGQFLRDGRWVCTASCRNELCDKQSYDDLLDSGGLVDAP